MNYKKVNQALAEEFGAGRVEVRIAPANQPWEYTLWFADDYPETSTIKRAKKFVSRFVSVKWYDQYALRSVDKTTVNEEK